jgi:hypothetical protein
MTALRRLLARAGPRRKYGDRAARMSPGEFVVQTVEDYARASGSDALLQLLRRFDDYNPSKPIEPKRRSAKTGRPKPPSKERDYAPIAGASWLHSGGW